MRVTNIIILNTIITWNPGDVRSVVEILVVVVRILSMLVRFVVGTVCEDVDDGVVSGT